MNMHNPPHPGEFIQEVYLNELNVSPRSIAIKLNVAPSTFHRVLKGTSNISAEMAIRLSTVLGRTPQSWLAMQDNFDLYNAYNKIDLSKVQSIQNINA
ncbi:Antitoxin HigA [uncultured Gammaproteobacteria bacterium]|uniref:HigA family addiction module antitoxin n=1 Tax=Bathymodiolus heckerae thiotrophic gill symbiont TaxID=1052212 RepID=UPI0010AF0378|nr:HigA family addiction module antitoxin [Bathymodiolus heckerae thiotrophic gill symbiont]CAC9597857.1 Antitoxin HigA [uncultured Gammaproteobacteria bacterium]CAC9603466.1 Antitoxin HigA [uncultured Gammaproteobacteria bacterium]CAC9603941.1 Antitoxin HigA [uncultured Gammaproteobacteria bacterium]CAC9962612.1 Antitoxin HigA [uncultured Gammaproteobacteria bacterium]SHN92685.1 HigA protein (antitoxin to HigB) [Bathymodiolus heckerae thiotrophic gill symbiont]